MGTFAPTLFALLSESPRLELADLRLLAQAYQAQMNDDVAPAYEGRVPWCVEAYGDLSVVPTPDAFGGDVIACVWKPAIPEAPGAAAYHSEDETGRAFVFCAVDENLDAPGGSKFSGAGSLAVDGSHEMVESFFDRDCSAWSMHASGLFLLANENADPTQGDYYSKPVPDGLGLVYVDVSNFVFPAYFDPQAPPEAGLDQMGLVKTPGEIRPGGYQSRIVSTAQGFAYTQAFGPDVSEAAKAKATRKASARIGRTGVRAGAASAHV